MGMNNVELVSIEKYEKNRVTFFLKTFSAIDI